MKFNDLDFDLDTSNPIEPVSLDLDLIKSKVLTHSSEKLCEMIVCDRYLGFNEEIAVICMEELSKRRASGDTFDFEKFIESASKELPDLNLGMKFDLRNILNQAIVRKNG